MIQTQLKEIDDEKEKRLAAGGKQATQVRALQHLKGIGPVNTFWA